MEVIRLMEDHEWVPASAFGWTTVEITNSNSVLILTFSEGSFVVRGTCWISGPMRHRFWKWINRFILDFRHSHIGANDALNVVICWTSSTLRLGQVEQRFIHSLHDLVLITFLHLEVRRKHRVVSLLKHVFLMTPRFIGPRGNGVLLHRLKLHDQLIVILIHEFVKLDFTVLRDATANLLRSWIDFLVFQLNLAVLYQIIDLEYFIPGLRFQFNLIVAHLVQITARGWNELVSVVVARWDVSETTSIVLVAVSRLHPPRICTLQIKTIHSMWHPWRPWGAGSREHSRVHIIWTILPRTIFLLLYQGLRIWVFYSLLKSISLFASASLGHGRRAGLARCWNHSATGIEHLEVPTVVMTQVTVFFLLSRIGFGRVGRATWTLILHSSEDALIHKHLLRTCPWSHIVRADVTPGHGRDLRGWRRQRQMVFGGLVRNHVRSHLSIVAILSMECPVNSLHCGAHLTVVSLLQSIFACVNTGLAIILDCGRLGWPAIIHGWPNGLLLFERHDLGARRHLLLVHVVAQVCLRFHLWVCVHVKL